MNDNEREILVEADDSLNLVNIFKMFWKNKVFIIILAVIMGALLFTKSAFFTNDTYTSSGIMYVNNKAETSTVQAPLNSTDLVVSRALGLTYLEILQTRSFLEMVSDDINGKYSWRELAGMTRIQTINDTELLRVSVVALTDDDAYLICKTIFDNAQEKLNEVYKTGTVEIADPPYMPDRANSRGVARNTIMGLFFGIVIGMVIIFIRNLFDKKVHNSNDVVSRYNISLLGELPETETVKKKGKNILKSNGYILNENSGFEIIETFKSIRTNIMFSIPKTEKGKVVVVTSSIPGEGKTTTTTNLAITFAQTGAKVLLVDCDLRKSRIHRYLKLERKIGMSDLLCGFADIKNAIKKSADYDFDVITAGEIPPNPAELFESDEFAKIISQLQEEYDYIFLDAPPISVVTDAVIIMQQAQGVVIVARENITTYDLLDETMDSINKAGANIFGFILLGSEEKRTSYSKYNKKDYKYIYADTPDEAGDLD